MGALSGIKELLREGRLFDALEAAKREVRSNPVDISLRYCLFELVCATGDWNRCKAQLETLMSLGGDPSSGIGILADLNASIERDRCWAGDFKPRWIGNPDADDLRLMVELEQAIQDGSKADSYKAWTRVREFSNGMAFGPGSVDGISFSEIATADDRLPGLLEVSAQGEYWWLLMGSVKRIEMAARSGKLSDLRWIPARVFLEDGSVSEMTIFGFYPGTETSDDLEARLAKRLSWRDLPDEIAFGEGPQMLWVDGESRPLHEMKVIEFTSGETNAETSNDPKNL